MDKNKNKAILESILFTMGESVDIERLAGVLELSEKTVEKYLDELKKEMDEDPSRGVTIMKLEGAYQMCSKSEMYE